MLTWTAPSLLGLGLLLAGSAAQAQQTRAVPAGSSPAASAATTPSGITLSYFKEAERPSAPVERTSAQVLPVPVPLPRGTPPIIAPDDFENPVPGGLKDGGPNQVVRLESEANFNRRLVQKVRQKQTVSGIPERAAFPEEPVITTKKYAARTFPGHLLLVEPAYVCYGPLLFQEKNAERYGWDLGIIQPPLQAGIFFADVVTLPYHLTTSLLRGPNCSAGQCLPGDPVPYMLYPPNLSLAGGVVEAGVIVGLCAVFP
jgi:hypothetical protein